MLLIASCGKNITMEKLKISLLLNACVKITVQFTRFVLCLYAQQKVQN
ncbi:hypothetical protein PPRY_b0437 [Pseudoalteromonas prydzensis ACAM 620]|nr:hypothetical protein [Pseudoalteromonas prydzensis ACAM 620]